MRKNNMGQKSRGKICLFLEKIRGNKGTEIGIIKRIGINLEIGHEEGN